MKEAEKGDGGGRGSGAHKSPLAMERLCREADSPALRGHRGLCWRVSRAAKESLNSLGLGYVQELEEKMKTL